MLLSWVEEFCNWLAVLKGTTRGYRHHPQLQRFLISQSLLISIAMYLKVIEIEATQRGYKFDATKIGAIKEIEPIITTQGQLLYEWHHLLSKLKTRAPNWYVKLQSIPQPTAHPLFQIITGTIEKWEIIIN